MGAPFPTRGQPASGPNLSGDVTREDTFVFFMPGNAVQRFQVGVDVVSLCGVVAEGCSDSRL